MNISREHKAGLEMALEQLDVTGSDAFRLKQLIAQASAAPEQEPVAWRGFNDLGEAVTEWIDGVPPARMVDLFGNQSSYAKIELAYTHADPSELAQLRADVLRLQGGRDLLMGDLERRDTTVDTLRSQLEAATQRADAAERKLGELQALLETVKEWLDDNHFTGSTARKLNDRLNELLSASAEPAECKCSLHTKTVGDGCSICNPELAAEYAMEAAEDDQHDLISNLTAIIDEELMPHAHKLPIQNLQRLNETLMAARKALE